MNEFQRKLSDHINSINKSSDVFIPADKTTNHYKMSPDLYNSLLKKNIEKEYAKAPAGLVHKMRLSSEFLYLHYLATAFLHLATFFSLIVTKRQLGIILLSSPVSMF